jgi:hypothetical protein
MSQDTTSNSQIVDVGGNLYRLEALIDSYAEILEQAKQQLEQFELSDVDAARIAKRAMERFNYVSLANEILWTFKGETEGAKACLQTITGQVQANIDANHIRLLIKAELGDLVNDRFDLLKRDIDLRFTKLLEAEAVEARTEARASTRMFEEMFRSVFGQQINDQIKRQANELAEDWQRRRAELDQQQAEG